jgi:hypothetical protein
MGNEQGQSENLARVVSLSMAMLLHVQWVVPILVELVQVAKVVLVVLRLVNRP